MKHNDVECLIVDYIGVLPIKKSTAAAAKMMISISEQLISISKACAIVYMREKELHISLMELKKLTEEGINYKNKNMLLRLKELI